MNFCSLSDNSKPNVFNTSADISISEEAISVIQTRPPLYSYRSNFSEFTQLEPIDELVDMERQSSRQITNIIETEQDSKEESTTDKFSECIKFQSVINNLFKQVEVLQKESLLKDKMNIKHIQLMIIKHKEEISVEKSKSKSKSEQIGSLQIKIQDLQQENENLKTSTTEFQFVNLDLINTIDNIQAQRSNHSSESNKSSYSMLQKHEELQNKLNELTLQLFDKSNELKELKKIETSWRQNAVHIESNSEVQLLEQKQKYSLLIQESEFQQMIFANMKLDKDQLYIKLQETLKKYQSSFEENEVLKQQIIEKKIPFNKTFSDNYQNGIKVHKHALTDQKNRPRHEIQNKSPDFHSAQTPKHKSIINGSPQSKENNYLNSKDIKPRKLQGDGTESVTLNNKNEQILQRCRKIAGLD